MNKCIRACTSCKCVCVCVSHSRVCECLYLGRPKKAKDIFKVWKESLLNREMANSNQHYEIWFYLNIWRERKKNTHAQTVHTTHTYIYITQVSENSKYIEFHSEFTAWIMFGQTQTYSTTRQSISVTSLPEYNTHINAIFPLEQSFQITDLQNIRNEACLF